VASLTDDLELAVAPNPCCTTSPCGFAQAARAREACRHQAEESRAAGVLRLVNQPPRHYGDSRLEPRRALTAASISASRSAVVTAQVQQQGRSRRPGPEDTDATPAESIQRDTAQG